MDEEKSENQEQKDSEQIYEIPIENLKELSNQPRKYYDEIEFKNLKNNIEKYGIINPIFISEADEIISGSRRVEAAKELGLKTVPAIYKKKNTDAIAVIDNIIRADFTVVEKAEALKGLFEQQKTENPDFTREHFGQEYRFKKSSVSEYFKIAETDNEIKDMLRDRPDATVRRLNKIVNIKDPEKRKNKAIKYKEELDSAQETQRSRTGRPKPEVAKNKINDFQKAIDKLSNEISGWETDQKTECIESLKSLKDKIDNILSQNEDDSTSAPDTGENHENDV